MTFSVNLTASSKTSATCGKLWSLSKAPSQSSELDLLEAVKWRRNIMVLPTNTRTEDTGVSTRRNDVESVPSVYVIMEANVCKQKAAPPGRCHSCNRAETPEWRRGPDGARTLCNACGLHYAKLTRKMGVNKAAVLTGSNLRAKHLDSTRP